jgi:hypothetical protein
VAVAYPCPSAVGQACSQRSLAGSPAEVLGFLTFWPVVLEPVLQPRAVGHAAAHMFAAFRIVGTPVSHENPEVTRPEDLEDP